MVGGKKVHSNSEAVCGEERVQALELSPDLDSLSSICRSMTLGKFLALQPQLWERLSGLLSGLNEIM